MTGIINGRICYSIRLNVVKMQQTVTAFYFIQLHKIKHNQIFYKR